jgi:serine/threonine-protein kinase RsbW
MITMAPPRPTERHGCRVRLTAEPAAAAEARRQVRTALEACSASVDPDVAVLLTSDLVTHAILHQAGGSITLDVRCDRGRLRVYVHGTADPGPGLVLVEALSDEWGSYRTPWGRATYFTLTSRGDR